MTAVGSGTGGSDKAIWIQIMEEMDLNGNNEISYPEFRDSLFAVLTRNIDDTAAIAALKISQRASVCIDYE